MKKRLTQSVCALLAATVLMPCSPIPTIAADISQDVREYRVVPREGSPYGLVDYDIADESGNIVDADSLTSPVRLVEHSQESLPSSYSSVSLGRVTPIKAQNGFGCCWAMTAVACAESEQLTKGAGEFDYSEDHLLWFRGKRSATLGDGVNMTSDIHSDYSSYNTGGSWRYAAGVLATWTGLVPESTAPFGTGGYAESERYKSSLYLTGAQMLGETTQDVRENSNAIKQHIVGHGAVSMSYYHDKTNIGSSGTSEYSYYQNSKTTSNHTVTIVGWDDNYAVTNFVAAHRPPSNGAWLVKNSHGTGLYDDGYMWLSYYDTSLVRAVGFSFTDTYRYDKNYQYDGFVSEKMVWFNNRSTVKMANVFCADADEKLGAVSFWTRNNNVSYTVKIYVSNFKTRGGTLAATQTGTLSNYGYHTVELSSPVSVTEGKYFTAEVSITVPEGEEAIAVLEGDGYSTEGGEVTYSSNAGESYLLYPSSGQWKDMSAQGDNNLPIKVFTVKERPSLSLDSSNVSLTIGGDSDTKNIYLGVNNLEGAYSIGCVVSDKSVVDKRLIGIYSDICCMSLTAKKEGVCTITFKLYNTDSELLDIKTLTVSVVSPDSLPQFTLSAERLHFDLGARNIEDKKTLSIETANIDSSDVTLRFSSYDEGSLSITGSTPDSSHITLSVKALAATRRTLIIELRDKSGDVLYDTLTVNIAAYDEDTVSLFYKGTKKLSFDGFVPVSFKSDSSAVSVSGDGLVTAASPGVAYITATDAQGDTVTTQFSVEYSLSQWLIIIFLFGWLWYI